MPRPFSDFTKQFFWNFKRMDNVNYNFDILRLLYNAKTSASNDLRFNKPIILVTAAIIECMLYDFIIRIQQHSGDIIPNLQTIVISHFRGKQIDQFETIINHTKKKDLLLAGQNLQIYTDLDLLRKIRNRVHIQDTKKQLHKDEYNVFTSSNLVLAQNLFVRVSEVLCNSYPRWGYGPIPMSDFPRPW